MTTAELEFADHRTWSPSDSSSDTGRRSIQSSDGDFPDYPTCWLSAHAQQRMGQRRIPEDTVIAVLTYGRVVYSRGAQVFALGRREVRRLAQHGLDLSDHEGIQVICSPDGSTVVTLYKDHDFSSLRPRRRRRGRRS